MELSNIYEVISQYSSLVAPLVLIILFFTKRALFLNIIWQNLFKKDYEFNDDTLGSAAKEQMDLEKYRLLFPKIKVRSIYHAKAMLTWCKNYNVGYEEVATQAEHLHYDELKEPKVTLTLPKSLNLEQSMNLFMVIALSLCLCLILFIPSLSGWSDRVLVKGKYSNTFLWVRNDAHLASAPMAEKHWEINADDCKDATSSKGKMDTKERAALCELVLSETEMNTFFEKSKKNSLTASMILLIMVIIPLIIFIKNFKSNQALKKLYRYVSSVNSNSKIETTVIDTRDKTPLP